MRRTVPLPAGADLRRSRRWDISISLLLIRYTHFTFISGKTTMQISEVRAGTATARKETGFRFRHPECTARRPPRAARRGCVRSDRLFDSAAPCSRGSVFQSGADPLSACLFGALACPAFSILRRSRSATEAVPGAVFACAFVRAERRIALCDTHDPCRFIGLRGECRARRRPFLLLTRLEKNAKS